MFYFLTHPDVVVLPDVPVPHWPLSARGRERMRQGLRLPWISEVRAVYCSLEQKALDGAEILAGHLGLRCRPVAELGENDRSATGFLPPPEFAATADAFFAAPLSSVRGWERAVDAQARIVRAVEWIAHDQAEADADAADGGAVAIVSHGAVGTLLYCHLAGQPIERRWDQPANGGGNFFRFTLAPRQAHCWWQPIDP